jgi:hypothetical protein
MRKRSDKIDKTNENLGRSPLKNHALAVGKDRQEKLRLIEEI